MSNIFDRIMFLRFLKDEEYIDETFLSIPLNVFTILTFVTPILISEHANPLVNLILFIVWFVALNQFYWFRKISLSQIKKDESKVQNKKQ